LQKLTPFVTGVPQFEQYILGAPSNVRDALACRNATNQELNFSGASESEGFGWLRHDKLKHIGH
jgi:hypothetical protein